MPDHVSVATAAAGDPVDRAHLTSVSRPSPPIHRYPPAPELAELITRYWIPVWSLAEPSTQSTLQFPVCLIVISNSYARFYGARRGASEVTLAGEGWGVGVLFRPAAGRSLLGRPVSTLVDTHLPLDEVLNLDGIALTAGVTSAMAAAPADPASHRAAIAVYERALAPFVPVDDQGRQINAIVDWLDAHPEVTRVSEVADAFGLSERALQRLVVNRVGLTPKWLIQRRRLHDAVAQLKAGGRSLADVAADLGYTDQAHFTHDFRTVTGLTPGKYLADQ